MALIRLTQAISQPEENVGAEEDKIIYSLGPKTVEVDLDSSDLSHYDKDLLNKRFVEPKYVSAKIIHTEDGLKVILEMDK